MARGKKITISKVRGWMYFAAKILGDVQAVRSPKKGAIKKRVARRIAGYGAGRFLSWLIR